MKKEKKNKELHIRTTKYFFNGMSFSTQKFITNINKVLLNLQTKKNAILDHTKVLETRL